MNLFRNLSQLCRTTARRLEASFDPTFAGPPPPSALTLNSAVAAAVEAPGLGDDPTTQAACIEAAWKAHLSGDMSAAQAKWEIVMRDWPELSVGYTGVSATALASGRRGQAVKAIEQALERFPDDQAVIAQAAELCSLQGDWKRSVALWEKIVDAENAPVGWLHSHAYAVLTLGRYDSVEPLLSELRRRFPDYRYSIALEAMLAEARQRFDESLALWGQFRRRFPDDPVGWEHYGRVHQARELTLVDDIADDRGARPSEPVVHASPVKVEVVDDEATRALLMNFESIGFNCEFGLVQRRFGAEPLGLLRFNSVELGGLVSALAHRFENMGRPETTELECLPNGEYFIKDRRWGLGMHTFVFKGQQDPDVLYSKFCRRVVFLKEKLLSDFGEAKKTFVFTSPALTRGELSKLHKALKSIAPVTLLHVKPVWAKLDGVDAPRAGDVIQIDRDLFVGFLNRHGVTPRGSWDIAFDDWVQVCRKVRNAVDESEVATAERDAP